MNFDANDDVWSGGLIISPTDRQWWISLRRESGGAISVLEWSFRSEDPPQDRFDDLEVAAFDLYALAEAKMALRKR